MDKQMNVLISLHRGYGLGDAVQMSAVLRHVRAARPDWYIIYQAEEGKHQVGRGIVDETRAYGDASEQPHYDAEVLICLYDTWANWGDRPNTRVSSALHEHFGLPWRAEYGRYQVEVSEYAALAVCSLLPRNAVAVHYRGVSSPDKKNLSHDQAAEICDHIERLGCVPVVLDWLNQCPSHWPYRRITSPQKWGGDAEMVCAVIGQCRAFVGIDSGPGKCASATDVPALITWTGHHPAPFHDPAPNTTHLVPLGYHGLEPVCNDQGVIRWFEENYSVRYYHGDGPVPQVRKWLEEVLR